MNLGEDTPILSVLQGDFDSLDFILTSAVIGGPKVQAHKARLGRQTTCIVGHFRYWVWRTERWTVYVSNEKGIGFNVPASSTPEQAKRAWADYKRTMGVTKGKLAKVRAAFEKEETE